MANRYDKLAIRFETVLAVISIDSSCLAYEKPAQMQSSVAMLSDNGLPGFTRLCLEQSWSTGAC